MTTIQHQAARMTREALTSLFAAARHVPEDKRDWTPMGEARTVQSLLYECAMTTPFYIAAVQGKMAEFVAWLPDEETKELWRGRSESASTLEGVEAVAQETFAELCQAVEAIPDQRLSLAQPHPVDPSKTACRVSARVRGEEWVVL